MTVLEHFRSVGRFAHPCFLAALGALGAGLWGCGSSAEKQEEPVPAVADGAAEAPGTALEEPPAPTDGPFHELSFDEALGWAKKTDRPLVIDFFTTWCGPCKVLDRTTWKDPEVVRWMSASTIALKLDAERETELARRYRIGGYPTVLVLDGEGVETRRLLGVPQIQKWIQKRAQASG